MALPYKYCAVSMDDLSLDVKNPRFASSTLVDNVTKVPSETDIIKHLLKYADVISLANDIERVHYLHGSEMITCYEDSDGKIVVAEGNRRVCACKLLLHRELIPDNFKETFPVATEETIGNIKVVTVNVYPNRESIQAYLSDRHIVGVRKWSALEKNNYYMNLFQQYGNIHMVKPYTSDTLGTVKKCIIKYQFFMKVFKVLKQNGVELEIEKIDYLPLADRFMDTLVGNDPEVGLSLQLDENRLVYLCPDSKKDLYSQILTMVGDAFLVRDSSGENPKIIGADVSNREKQKKLIMEDKRIPGLYDLIKCFKRINASNDSCTPDDPDSPERADNHGRFEPSEPFVPERFIPQRRRDDYLYITEKEAENFIFESEEYDAKILEILRELAIMRVSEKPVACACLFRCLLEICTRRVFKKYVNPSVKRYNESDLLDNLIYVNNNVLFNGLNGSENAKIQSSIKGKLGSGLINTLNLYIHYPQAVDPSYLTDSWTIMKLFVARCLSI